MTTREMALRNYARGLWTDDMLAKLTEKGRLTAGEFEEITGEAYTGASPASEAEAILNELEQEVGIHE